MTERFAKYFSGKSILIMGLGIEGSSSLDFILTRYPDSKIAVYDKNPLRLGKNIRFLTGSISSIMDRFDLILKSPGVPLPEDFVSRNSDIISSQTDIFLREFHDRTIGITGTKGKSTTSTLLDMILKNSGMDSVIAGNIGVPAFDIISRIDDETKVVLELSSHQLQFIKRAPHISAILNVYPEHLDFYKNFAEYMAAKMNIARFQSENDRIVYPQKEFPEFNNISEAFPFELMTDGDDVIVYCREKSFVLSKKFICLKGSHNLYNIGAALILSYLAGCSMPAAIQTVYNFKGLEHRLEFFGTFGGIDFYNDSISTIPQAASAALRSFENSVGTLILGGHFRGDEIVWDPLSDELKKTEAANLIFLPDTGSMIYDHLIGAGFTEEKEDGQTRLVYGNRRSNCFFCNSLEEAVPVIYRHTPKGSVCLLSPASSSYNMFKNFEERGAKFKNLIISHTRSEI